MTDSFTSRAAGQKLASNGPYKGTVVSNVDPLKMNRLLVQVPDVLGLDPCIWAESGSPLSGTQMGLSFVPMIGAGVWIQFQNLDPNYAVWTGCWRGSAADVPVEASLAPPALPPIIIQSQAQNKIINSSVPGQGIRLETALGRAGPSIELTEVGIILKDGKGAMITLLGGVVTINMGALVIK
jgi:hypothetical protein